MVQVPTAEVNTKFITHSVSFLLQPPIIQVISRTYLLIQLVLQPFHKFKESEKSSLQRLMDKLSIGGIIFDNAEYYIKT